MTSHLGARVEGDEDAWHTGYTFNREIPSVGTLRAEVVPEMGGDTVWASTYAAYEACHQ